MVGELSSSNASVIRDPFHLSSIHLSRIFIYLLKSDGLNFDRMQVKFDILTYRSHVIFLGKYHSFGKCHLEELPGLSSTKKGDRRFSKLSSDRETMDISSKRGNEQNIKKSIEKPPYVVAEDDTKPVLRDPLWSSDPTQAEQAVLRLPPFPAKTNVQFK